MKLLNIIVADVLVLTAVTLQPAVLRRFGSPPIRGFYCDDETIRYPYMESTISIPVLYVVGVGIAVTIIVFTELLLEKRISENASLLGIRMPLWVVNCYKYIGVFSFGAASVQVISQAGTFTLGRLRPNFIAVCEPDVDCSQAESRHAYIGNYTCLGTAVEKIHDSRLSFPSGHACFSSFAALYMVLYIQRRWHIKGSCLLKPTVQLGCILLSWATSLSRIHDYQHHWSDVVVGLIIGISTAVFAVTFVMSLFDSDNENTLGNNPPMPMSPINGSTKIND